MTTREIIKITEILAHKGFTAIENIIATMEYCDYIFDEDEDILDTYFIEENGNIVSYEHNHYFVDEEGDVIPLSDITADDIYQDEYPEVSVFVKNFLQKDKDDETYNKILSLSCFLELSSQEMIDDHVKCEDGSGNKLFSFGKKEYYVLTNEEADKLAEEIVDNYIEECVLPEIPERYRNLINSKPLVEEATRKRGEWLASYDSREEEHGDFYIYRIN